MLLEMLLVADIPSTAVQQGSTAGPRLGSTTAGVTGSGCTPAAHSGATLLRVLCVQLCCLCSYNCCCCCCSSWVNCCCSCTCNLYSSCMFRNNYSASTKVNSRLLLSSLNNTMSRYATIYLTLLLMTFTATNCLLTREKLVTISEHVVEHLQRDINSEDTTEELKAAMARPQVSLEQILEKFPFLIQIADRLARIEENIWYVENAYNYLSQFLKNVESYKPYEAKYAARAFLDIGSSVDNIFNEVAIEKPPKKPSVFSILGTNLNPRKTCVSEKSAELIIDSLFKLVCYAEVHALIVEWNSIKILERLGKEVGVDKEELVNEFKTRLLQLWEKANATLQNIANNKEDKCTQEEEEEDSYDEDVDDENSNSS